MLSEPPPSTAAEDAVKTAKATGNATMIANADTELADAVASETAAVEDEAVAEETLGAQPPTESAEDSADGGGSAEAASLAADPRLLSPDEDTSSTSIAAAQEAAITIMDKPKAMMGLKALQFAPMETFTPGAETDSAKTPAANGGDDDEPAGAPGQ